MPDTRKRPRPDSRHVDARRARGQPAGIEDGAGAHTLWSAWAEWSRPALERAGRWSSSVSRGPRAWGETTRLHVLGTSGWVGPVVRPAA
jgi:hypothetical protein